MINANIRPADNKELAAWNEVQRLSEMVHGGIYAAQLKNANAALAYKWGVEHNQPIDSPKPIEDKLLALERDYNMTRDAIRRVEDREWGLRFVGDKIEIVSPKLEEPTMGGWIIPVIIGGVAAVVVVADIVSTVHKDLTRHAEVVAELNRYKTMTEEVFSKNPKTYELWKQFAAQTGYEEREEESEGILDKIGKGIATGAKWGIGVGIAALAVMLVLSMRKK